MRNRIVTREGEIQRLTSAAAAARARAEEGEQELSAREADLSHLDEGELGLDERHEAAAAALAAAEAQLQALGVEERESERERTGYQARRDALAMSLARTEGAAAVAEALGDEARPAAGDVTVEPGAEAAIAAALGAAADGWSVPHFDAAVSAALRLRAADAGRAALLVTGLPRLPAVAAAPDGLRWARDLVKAPDQLAGALDRLLADVAVALTGGPEEMRAAVSRGVAAGLRVVTRDGDLAGEALVIGGPAGGQSTLELVAEIDAAEEHLAEAVRRGERARFALAGARQQRERALTEVEAALAALHDSDARMSAVAEQLADLAASVRAAQGEAERLETARASATESFERDQEELATLQERLAAAQAAPEEVERPTDDRDRLAAATTAARSAEVEARLAVRTAEERVQAMAGRAASLRRAAVAEREARQRAEAARARREQQAGVAVVVAELAARALDRLESALQDATADLDTAEESARTRHAALGEARDAVRLLSDALGELREQLHRDEVGQVERRLRVESLEEAAVQEHGVPPDDLIAGFGPEVLVPAEEAGKDPTPFVRAEQEARLATAEKALARLGKVNPLALEEYEALQERSTFLATQLRRPGEHPARSDAGGPRGGRAGAGGLPHRLRGHRTRIRDRLRDALPRRPRQARARPTPMTCSRPASRSRPVRRARKSPGCRCCPAASVRSRPWRCCSRSSAPAPRPSMCSTRSRPRSTTATWAGCSRPWKGCGSAPSWSSSRTRSARWRSPTPCTA